MGASASTKQLQKEAQKPIDASDIKEDLADAKKEITRLRTLIKEESEKLIDQDKGRVQSVTVRCLPEEEAEGKTGNVVAVNAEQGGPAEGEDGATGVQQEDSGEGKGEEAPQPIEATSQDQDNSQTPAANDATIEAEGGAPADISAQDETHPDDAGPKRESKGGGVTAPSAEISGGNTAADVSCTPGEADSKRQNLDVLKAGDSSVTAVEGSHDMKVETANAVAAAAS